MKTKRKQNFGLAQWVGIFKGGRKFYHLSDLMKFSGLPPSSVRKATQRLLKEGLLIKLYPEFFGNTLATYQTEEVAGAVYPPSYVSCETALFHHGVIDQAPFKVVSVSTRKTKRIKIGANELIYHKIATSLFWGYTRAEGYLLAEPEKALLDWLYLNPKKDVAQTLDEINWDQVNLRRLKKYVSLFPPHIRRMLKPFLD